MMFRNNALYHEVGKALTPGNINMNDYITAKGQLPQPPVFHIRAKNGGNEALLLKRLFEEGDFEVTLGALGDKNTVPDFQQIGYNVNNELLLSFNRGVTEHNKMLRFLN